MSLIYIVEDDKSIREIETFALGNVGYEVKDFANAGEFYKALDARKPDLILLDIMLPDEDGLAIVKKLRKWEETRQLPIIMVTAKTTEIDKVKGLDMGADDYMTKPVNQDEFLYRIKALLRRAKIANERKIVVGDVILDYDSLTVTKGNEVQELPQKEFMLLYKLLSYPGKIFTRIQLMDEIWGAESETGWETVTVHVGRLRKRFEGWQEFEIESVRGLGYKAVKKV